MPRKVPDGTGADIQPERDMEPERDMNPEHSEKILSLRLALDERESATQQFLNRLVHDLRAAHRAAAISSEILVAKAGASSHEEELQRTVRHLTGGLTKMDAILSGASAYSLSLRASAYKFTTVPMELALRLSLAGIEKEVRETGAAIHHDQLPQVVGDRDQLSNLFRNLIDNAIKYRGTAPPRVEIGAVRGPDHWVVSVQDNGVGIDHKYLDGIFTPFSRLHGTEIPGVGLGLTICKNIVDAHQGTIRVESTVGQGTTFFFTIPAGLAAPEQQEPDGK
jgi:two-component system, chemotaxis family, sensor kinase Cph1